MAEIYTISIQPYPTLAAPTPKTVPLAKGGTIIQCLNFLLNNWEQPGAVPTGCFIISAVDPGAYTTAIMEAIDTIPQGQLPKVIPPPTTP